MSDQRESEIAHLRAELARMREREAHFARVLGVADGGRYRNDWDAPLRRVLGENERLRAENAALRTQSTPAGAGTRASVAPQAAMREGYREAVEFARHYADTADLPEAARAHIHGLAQLLEIAGVPTPDVELDRLRRVGAAARRLISYQVTGEPDHREWEAYFDALAQALGDSSQQQGPVVTDDWATACRAATSHLDYVTDAPAYINKTLRQLRKDLDRYSRCTGGGADNEGPERE